MKVTVLLRAALNRLYDRIPLMRQSKVRRIDQTSPVTHEEIEAIRASGLFDADYYIATYPDIQPPPHDPIRHYCEHGWREGRNPSKEFDTRAYLEAYNDVRETGINPFLHYALYGQQEGRLGFGVKIYGSMGDEFDPSRESVIVVSHEATRTGAPILALNLVRVLSQRYNVL
ncbi:MAG: hypothetical protein IJM64_08970, partial [Ottowia sp.]|nr:hypothetical protein [Ottowia sp.]